MRHLKLMGDLGQVIPLPYDVTDRNSITRAMQRSNVVINLLGSRRETIHHSYEDVHVRAAQRVAECAAASGAERLIHFSALGAAADSPSAFYRSKFAGEQAVLAAFPNATIVRPAPVFGPEDHLLLRFASLIHNDATLPFLEGREQSMQPIWVGDVAAATVNAILDPATKGRTIELAGPEVMTDLQVAYEVFRVLKEKSTVEFMSDKKYRCVLVSYPTSFYRLHVGATSFRGGNVQSSHRLLSRHFHCCIAGSNLSPSGHSLSFFAAAAPVFS